MPKSSFLKKLTGSKKTTPRKSKARLKQAKKKKSKSKRPLKKIHKESIVEGQLGIDLYQTDNELILRATIAGVKPSDIDVDITNESVTIKGRRHTEEKVSGNNFFYQECYWGSFSRSVLLPVEINADKAKAALKDGILTIKMPKASQAQGRKLEIKA